MLCQVISPSPKQAFLAFSFFFLPVNYALFFFLLRVVILNPARRALQEGPSLSWILAAGKGTPEASDRSCCRRWAMSLAGGSGRMPKVGRRAGWRRGRGGERGAVWGVACSFSPQSAGGPWAWCAIAPGLSAPSELSRSLVTAGGSSPMGCRCQAAFWPDWCPSRDELVASIYKHVISPASFFFF